MTSRTDHPEIEGQIRGFIARQVLYSETGFAYGDDVSFLQEGIIDSLGVMELVEFVQKTFGVSVAQQEVTPEHFDSIAKLGSFIRHKLRGPTPP